MKLPCYVLFVSIAIPTMTDAQTQVANSPVERALKAIQDGYGDWIGSENIRKAIDEAGAKFDSALDEIARTHAGVEPAGTEHEGSAIETKLVAIALHRRSNPERYREIEAHLRSPISLLTRRPRWRESVPADSPLARESYRLAWEYWLLRPHTRPEYGPSPDPMVLINMQNGASLVTLEHMFFLASGSKGTGNYHRRLKVLSAIGGFPPELSLPLLTKCLQRADEVGDCEALSISESILRGEKFRPLLKKLSVVGLSSNVVGVIQRALAYEPPPPLPPPPPKVDYFGPVSNELEALGYDLMVDDETFARIRDDLVKYVWTETEEMFNAGKISHDEMERLQAQRYKEWFLKNMQPTLPPKANDTNTETTPVEP